MMTEWQGFGALCAVGEESQCPSRLKCVPSVRLGGMSYSCMEFPWVLYVEKKIFVQISTIQVIIKPVPNGAIQRKKSPQCWGILH